MNHLNLGCQGPARASCSRSRSQGVITRAFFGRGSDKKSERQREREEAFRAQQAVVARRKSNSWQKGVEERRAEVRKYRSNPEYKKRIDDERRERKKKDNPDPPVNPWSIIIPISPIGLPEYDDGERFDLRFPYAEKGYVDEDADFRKQFARFFGFGKKKAEDVPDSKKKPKK